MQESFASSAMECCRAEEHLNAPTFQALSESDRISFCASPATSQTFIPHTIHQVNSNNTSL